MNKILLPLVAAFIIIYYPTRPTPPPRPVWGGTVPTAPVYTGGVPTPPPAPTWGGSVPTPPPVPTAPPAPTITIVYP